MYQMFYQPTNSEKKLVETVPNRTAMHEFLDLREQLAKAMDFYTKREGDRLILLDNTKQVGVYYATQTRQKED